MSESVELDLDRGVVQKMHPQGFYVCMYCDTPGAFISAGGDTISQEIAKEAGFDTNQLYLDRRRNELMAEKRAEVEKEISALEHGDSIDPVVLASGVDLDKENGDRYMKHRGHGTWDVFDGPEMIATKVSKKVAYDTVHKQATTKEINAASQE